MKPLKKSVSITLDEDVIEQLKSRAENCDRSLSQYINLVLKRHLKQNPQEDEEVEQQSNNNYVIIKWHRIFKIRCHFS